MAPCEDWEYEMVNKLVAQGKLSIEFITQRLDSTIATGSGFPDEAKLELRHVFDTAANNEGLLTEPSLLVLLQRKSTIALSPELAEANKIIFSALKYLSTLPFGPKIGTHVEGITFAEFSRALVWILPETSGWLFEEDNFSRARKPADHRRLLFQSIALRHDHPLYEASIARKLALRNAFNTDQEFGADLSAMNYDDDGDESFHDLLEILYSSQDQIPGRLGARPDSLRPLAKRISTETDLPVIRTLGIPTERFITLIRVLLAMQFHPPATGEEPVNLLSFTPAAVAICAAFEAPDTHHLITHPSFESALEHLAPYLFDPLHQFLSLTFLGRTHGHLSANIDAPIHLSSTPSPDSILTIPLVAQLTAFLCWSFDYTSLEAHAMFTPSAPAESASRLIKSLVPPNNFEPPALLLLQGYSTVTSERVVFGLFTPHPDKDGDAIQDVSVPHVIGNHGCMLFQLAPVHGVFRGTIGKPAWSVLDEETVVFGEVGGAGVSMTLALPSSGSRQEGGEGRVGRASVRQIVVDSGDEEEKDETRGWDREEGWFEEARARKEREKEGWTYEADVKRGNWIVEFEIERMEAWSARELE